MQTSKSRDLVSSDELVFVKNQPEVAKSDNGRPLGGGPVFSALVLTIRVLDRIIEIIFNWLERLRPYETKIGRGILQGLHILASMLFSAILVTSMICVLLGVVYLTVLMWHVLQPQLGILLL